MHCHNSKGITLDYMNFDLSSDIPKSTQIVQSIQNAVKQNILKPGDKIPSFNEMVNSLSISRETVYRAYSELKNLGVILSSPGKGYFITQSQGGQSLNIFMLLDSFTPYKEVLFSSFKKRIGNEAIIHLFFHHFNDYVYKKIIYEAVGKYTDYVLSPLSDQDNYHWLKETLPNHSVYILDTGLDLYGSNYPCVCQNFEREVYECLLESSYLLSKYDQMILLWGDLTNPHRQKIKEQVVKGFNRFCQKQNMPYRICIDFEDAPLKKNACYIINNDFDLTDLYRAINHSNWKLGKDIGIISFNESPLKSVIGNGITTLSTDFEAMGKTMADMVLNKSKHHYENLWKMNIRGSL